MEKSIFIVKEDTDAYETFKAFIRREDAVDHIVERAVAVWGKRWGKTDRNGIGLDERSLKDKVRDILYDWNHLGRESDGLYITADESMRLPYASWDIIDSTIKLLENTCKDFSEMV